MGAASEGVEERQDREVKIFQEILIFASVALIYDKNRYLSGRIKAERSNAEQPGTCQYVIIASILSDNCDRAELKKHGHDCWRQFACNLQTISGHIKSQMLAILL